MDVNGVTVDVYTAPINGAYANAQTLSDGDVLRPTLLPEVSIRIADIPR